MSEWHENIPPQGILCKTKHSELLAVTHIVKANELGETINVFGNGDDDVRYLTPLTAEELWHFMPLQTIDTAPKNGDWFMAIDTEGNKPTVVKNHKSAIGDYFIDRYMTVIHFEKWLPLPKGDL